MDFAEKFKFYMKELSENGTTLGEMAHLFPGVFKFGDTARILENFESLHKQYFALQSGETPAKRPKVNPKVAERSANVQVKIPLWQHAAETEGGEFLKSLAEKGYAVVRVMTEADAARIQGEYEKSLDQMNPLWREAGIPGANGCGIIKNFRAGSPNCVHAGRWACREFLSKVLYGGRPCCTSLDAVAFGIIPSAPPKVGSVFVFLAGGVAWRVLTIQHQPSTLKPHTDMALNSPSHKLVQEMEKRGEKIPILFQGQLCIYSHEDGPHFLAGKVAESLPVNPRDQDFTVLPGIDPAALAPVKLKPGELLVWRSDLVSPAD